jgi:hypothetical protein
MNPPAAIDAVFNRTARREALAAVPVLGFDTALPPLRFQVDPAFLRDTSFRFLASTASSNLPAWGRLETNRATKKGVSYALVIAAGHCALACLHQGGLQAAARLPV